MATEETDESEGPQASGGVSKILVWLVVAVLAIGGGAATPIVIAQLGSSDGQPEEKQVIEEPDPEEEVEFIDFDEVTINLDEARFSRYLRINFSLQVAKSQKADIEKQVDAKSTIFKNWLQTNVSEMSTEDLRGKHGRNRLRRQMHDYFNQVLFDDGIERIQDVLFIEFHVQ
jgi:flagellar FliL protein